ncbi:Mu transposase C-terminal domain-containing protein [Egbenema bharatensis]|uniref:Mu transposase C-terminal domain-containing protein n=1 Tax=Egbenema bharatensis TaxID=3463334 RepID=UPI003A8AC429
MSDDRPETELPECPDNAVLLDETSYSTNIHEYVRELVQQGIEKEEWKFWIIQWVAESLTPAIKRVRKQSAIEYLGAKKRTFEDWLAKHLAGEPVPRFSRGKKPKHDLTLEWEPFIINAWKKGSKGKRIMNPAAVHRKVEREALDIRKTNEYPSYSTVRRILQPLIEKERAKNGASSAGQGTISHLLTRAGETLKVDYSNKVIQIDHTKVDAFSLIIDGKDQFHIVEVEDDSIPPIVGAIRLYLSVAKDVFSKCILGHLLSVKQPSSEDVAQLIRKVILPKQFPPDYDLRDVQVPYGSFSHLYVDGGKDLTAEHVKQIGRYLKRISPGLGFIVHLRRKPSDGGDVESVFGGLNKRVWSEDPSYTGSNTTERPKDAQEKACLTFRDMDKRVSWYFYGEYNNENHTKDPTETRYTMWLEGMDGELPPVIDEKKLDSCLRKMQDAKVYRDGVVQFKNRHYQGEFLRAFAGQSVTIRYSSDDILRLRAYELETDAKPGRFLGFVEMRNVYEINKWIDKLKLPIKKLELNNLKSETFSLEELEEVLAAVKAGKGERKSETEPIRMKYRGKGNDLVKSREKELRKRRSQTKNSSKKNSKHSRGKASSVSTAPPTTPELNENPSSNGLATTQQEHTTPAPTTTAIPDPRKVISMQEKFHEKNVESFEEQLMAAEANRPRLVVPRRKGRSW